jgi:hypothetical protein
MALFIQITDDFGNPDAVSNLADAIIEKVLPKGVGLFRGKAHVAEDIRAAVNELIRQGQVSVQNPVLKACPVCEKAVSIWHTYPDGSVYCTDCKPGID